jgi:hypothetical protein
MVDWKLSKFERLKVDKPESKFVTLVFERPIQKLKD